MQFCAHEPQHLLHAARMVEASGMADAIDINFGCPQRIAKRGKYGAFLMDDLPRVEALVRTLSQVRAGVGCVWGVWGWWWRSCACVCVCLCGRGG